MDNAELIPPTPKSMSDWELEQALETAKAQSDGMLAAMILLEQESQLRTEDDAAVHAWISRLESMNTSQAQSALADFYLGNPRFAKQSEESPAEPVQESPALAEPVPAVENLLDAEPAPIIPVPIPAPVSQEVAFDEILALGSQEATDAIDLPEIADSIDEAEVDFSVTGVLGQIVQQVNSDFSADEDATALEESEHQPIAAFEQESSTPKVKAGFAWGVFWGKVPVLSLAIPLLAALWAVQNGVALISLAVGITIALVLNFLLQMAFRGFAFRGERDVTVLSRATFGVIANTVPVALLWAFRSLLLVVAAVTASLVLLPTFAGAPVANAASPAQVTWLSLAALALLALASIVALFSEKVRQWIFACASILVFATLAIIVIIASPAVSLGSLDPAQVTVISLVALIAALALSGLGQGAAQHSGSKTAKTASMRADLVSSLVLPVVSSMVFGIAFSLPTSSASNSNLLAELFLSLPVWLATSSVWISALFSLVLVAILAGFASESLNGLFISRRPVRALITGVAAIGLVIAIGMQPWMFDYCSRLVLVLMVAIFAWLGAVLTEALLRRADFHEVSLLRSYAFYKRISIAAILGFILSVFLGIGLTTIDSIAWTGFLTKWLDPILFFGNLSGALWAFVFAVVWTLITSVPKIHKQELEIAAIDERRSEIAGVELPQ